MNSSLNFEPTVLRRRHPDRARRNEAATQDRAGPTSTRCDGPPCGVDGCVEIEYPLMGSMPNNAQVMARR